MEITRDTTVDATPAEVWEVLADEEERAAWLGDDGADRPMRIDEATPGERLAWTWWTEEGGDASTVSITLTPLDGGGTAVRVVERLQVPVPQARVRAAVGGAWTRRLVGVELSLLLACSRV